MSKKEITAFISRMRDVAQLDDTSAQTRESLNSHADALAALAGIDTKGG